MSSWKDFKLGDVAEVKGGKRLPKGELLTTEKTPHPYIRITDFDGHKINLSAIQYVTEEVQKSISRYIVNKQDIIISNVGTIGLCAKIPDELDNANLTENCVKLVFDKNKIDTNFLYYHLISPDTQELINGLDVGSTQPKLPIYNIQKIDISLPPLEEQKAIAEVLSSLDDKIDLLHRQNKTLESLAQTIFRQWFIEEAKEEWEEVLITDLFEVRDGTHDSPKQKEFGKKLLTSKHILKNKLDFESSYFISEEDFEKINQRSVVEQGDILFSMIGTIGLTYLEQSNEIDYAIKNIGLFKTSQNKKFMYFVYLWLNSSFGVEFIHENRSGSTQEYISLGSLRNIIFNLPNYKIIDLFNEKMEPIFEKINTNMKQIKSLENLRDTPLPKLFSGEIKIKD